MSVQINDILQDPSIVAADKQKISIFRALVESTLNNQEPPGSNWKGLSMFHFCESVGIDLSSLPKEGQVLSALWVIVLRCIRKYVSDEELKYPEFENFTEVYAQHFPRDEEHELRNLWQIANWMSILFQLMPAKKNKGLAMLVAPRFIEGWHVKYVTGSGQTHFTANRVKVFETEGDCKACHRGKLKTKPKLKKLTHEGRSTSNTSEETMDSEDAAVYTLQHRELSMTTSDYTHHRKRKVSVRRESSFESEGAQSTDAPTRRAKRPRQENSSMLPPPPIPGRCTTDLLRSASNEDAAIAYKEFTCQGIQRDETALLIPDLMRSESWMVNANGMMPPPLPNGERNITWGEIPVLNSQSSYGPGIVNLSNFGTMSVGSNMMYGMPIMKPEASEASSVFDGASPPLAANGFVATDKMSDIFGAFMNPFQSSSNGSNVQQLGSPSKVVYA